jgi:hypothetical protein
MQQQQRNSILPFRKQPYEMNCETFDLRRVLRETIDSILGGFPSMTIQSCVEYLALWCRYQL